MVSILLQLFLFFLLKIEFYYKGGFGAAPTFGTAQSFSTVPTFGSSSTGLLQFTAT
jgi:hypothetical protein